MSNETSPAPTRNLRRNLLLAVLALLTVGLVYDFAVARPAVEDAYSALTKKNAEFNIARRHRAMGVADVRELMGCEPSRTFEDRELHVEVYSWRSGLPFRTHDLYVVYRTVLGEKFLTRLTKFEHEAEDEFYALLADEPGYETRPFIQPTASGKQPLGPTPVDGAVPDNGVSAHGMIADKDDLTRPGDMKPAVSETGALLDPAAPLAHAESDEPAATTARNLSATDLP